MDIIAEIRMVWKHCILVVWLIKNQLMYYFVTGPNTIVDWWSPCVSLVWSRIFNKSNIQRRWKSERRAWVWGSKLPFQVRNNSVDIFGHLWIVAIAYCATWNCFIAKWIKCLSLLGYRVDGNFLYGVFDGHDGSKVSKFAAQRMPAELLLGQLPRRNTDNDTKAVLIEVWTQQPLRLSLIACVTRSS